MPNISRSMVTVALAAALMVPAAGLAKGITVEGENPTGYNDTGGTMIHSLALSGCSGGYVLVGLDNEGEWADYNVTVPAFGYYTFLMKCRGDLGVSYHFRLVFTPAETGTAQTVEFLFVGKGYG